MNLSMFILAFLYFPEDKSLYKPAFIELGVMLVLCIIAFILFRKLNKKQMKKAQEIEQRILQNRQHDSK